MRCFYHARDAIDLVAATVDTFVGIVEHTIFVPHLVDCSATTHGVIFAKYVAQIAKQQGRYAVGHGLSPLGIERLATSRPGMPLLRTARSTEVGFWRLGLHELS